MKSVRETKIISLSSVCLVWAVWVSYLMDRSELMRTRNEGRKRTDVMRPYVCMASYALGSVIVADMSSL